jgi:membrane protease YdiL (CAAX protease family)
MDPLIFSLSFAILVAVVFLAAAVLDRRVAVTFALLAALYIGLDDFITGLPPALHILDIGTDWNWSGKLLSLLLAVVVIFALRLSPDGVGLKKPIHWKICVVAIVLFVVWGACLGLLFQPGHANTETFAFQATMPGLAEELVYRGIVPVVLFGLIRRRDPSYGIPWVVILATSVAFGIWHGLGYAKGSFSFDAMGALFPFIGSVPGGWLRFKTDSILIPILAHSVANVAFHVAGGFMA